MYIRCKTHDLYKKVIDKLDSEGYKWASGRELKYRDNWGEYEEKTVLHIRSDKRVTYGDHYCTSAEEVVVNAEDFVREQKATIIIYRNGNTVTALDKGTGKKGIAKCSQHDAFDMKIGTKIALLRLWGEEIPATLTADNGFSVGDRVRVLPWEKAKKHTNFADSMRRFCEKTATIKAIGEDSFFAENAKKVSLEFEDGSSTSYYTFDTAMIEKISKAKGDKKPRFSVGERVTLKERLNIGTKYEGLTLYDHMYSLGFKRPMIVKEIRGYCDGFFAYLCEGEDGRDSHFYSSEMLKKWDENAIHEGDIVRVINIGLTYTAYPQWVSKHISDPDMAARYCFSTPSACKKYKVIKIAEHESNGRALAYIEEIDGLHYNSCYLIEVKGLKKVTE